MVEFGRWRYLLDAADERLLLKSAAAILQSVLKFTEVTENGCLLCRPVRKWFCR